MKKKVKGSKPDESSALKEQLARALADYDNLRKRTERERMELEALSTVRFLGRLLPIFDMLDNVQVYAADSGLAIALNELNNTLADEGYEKIFPAEGEAFDENLHEAVDTVNEEDKDDGIVVATQLSGWRLKNGFVIRPAKVIVNKKE